MKKCPKCNNVTDSKFCPECGYDMSSVETFVCPKCGNESNSLFCPNCGTKMQSDPAEAVPEPITVVTETVNKQDDIVSFPAAETGATAAAPAPAPAPAASAAAPKDFGAMLKKKPAIIAIVAAVVLIALIASLGSGGKSKSTNTSSSTESYSTTEDSSQQSDYSSSTTTSSSFSAIQGTWKLAGVVNDGESSNLRGMGLGSLTISGDQWTMKINTSDASERSGTLYYNSSGTLESGDTYIIYTMQAGDTGGSVKMTYSDGDEFIAVSTSGEVDANNCFLFER